MRIAWAVPPVASTPEAEVVHAARRAAVAAGLSVSQTLMKTVPSAGSCDARRGLRLAERGREVLGDPHHLAGRLHLRPEQRVGALEALERAAPPP